MEDYKSDDYPSLPSIAPRPGVATTPSRPRPRWICTTTVLGIILTTLGLRIAHKTFSGNLAPTSSAAISAFAEPEFDWFALTPSDDIIWTPCFVDYKCARVILPLDYLSPPGVGPNVTIALQMLPATDTENYKGTIFINPGGPGGSGTNLASRAGKNISSIVGPAYDILGFDPRGIGASTPNAQCFDSESQFKIWSLQGGGLLSLNDTSVGAALARESVIGQRCQSALGGNGKEEIGATAEEWGSGRFMSTASVATDMLRISEKLGQKKLQYWGFSYGSILGQYFSAMYPDKVGRVVIDGVYDAYNYRGSLWNSNLADTDAVRDAFFTFCHQAGPAKCALYAPTVDAIKTRVNAIMDGLTQEPIAVPFAVGGPTILTKEDIITLLFRATYKPTAQFGIVADTIIAAESNNVTALTTLVPGFKLGAECSCQQTPEWLADNEAFHVIACGDGEPVSYEPDAYNAYFSELSTLSPFAGPIWGIHYLQCAQWSVRPKWRYTGPLGANATANPLLIVSPMYDPVCPLSDARKVHARYGGSGLLIQNSYGHCSLSAPSICTAKYVRAYFQNGTLPEEGTVCEVDELPFVGSVQDESIVMSMEDRELLGALKGLGDIVPAFGNF